jgi:hypothetical protein
MLLGVNIPPLENLHTAVEDYQALHERLGHANDKMVAATAKKLGIKYTGYPHPCYRILSPAPIGCYAYLYRDKSTSFFLVIH